MSEPNWKTLMVNTADLESGNFYKVYIDNVGGTLLLKEVPTSETVIKKEFTNINYLEVAFKNDRSIQVFEKVKTEGIELYNLINDAIDIRVRKGGDGENLCIINSNREITGHVILK